MHKKIFLILFLSLSTYANETITLSTPKTNVLKDKNITLSITPSNINPKDITWIVKPKNSLHVNNLTITPIKDTTITVRAKYKNKISNPIILHVKWIVNGHTLPPYPDEKINNSTLLGIDVNNNGVRDDVERWIYKTYKDKHPIHIDIAMQAARAYKKVIVEPKKARETMKYRRKHASCMKYWKREAIKNNENYSFDRYKSVDKEIKPIQSNTAKRLIAFDRYLRNLSGIVFSWTERQKSDCEFDKNGNLK